MDLRTRIIKLIKTKGNSKELNGILVLDGVENKFFCLRDVCFENVSDECLLEAYATVWYQMGQNDAKTRVLTFTDN